MSIRRMEILINAVKSWYFRILARSPRLVFSGVGVMSLVQPRFSYLINNTANDLWQRGSRVSSYVRQYIDWLLISYQIIGVKLFPTSIMGGPKVASV